MRLYRINPRYLDQKGLCGLWREALVAQRVLVHIQEGRHGHPYRNHPQMKQFKELPEEKQLLAIGQYLWAIWAEGKRRGYKFDRDKILSKNWNGAFKLPVTEKWLEHESQLLREKLLKRAPQWWKSEWNEIILDPHPFFKIVE